MTHAPLPVDVRPRWLERGKIPGLDGLRAVAISLVVLEHASITHAFPIAPGSYMRGLGDIGVGLFFCLSGFLISILLMREWTDTGTASLLRFYTRRILRILPAYCAFLIIVFLLTQLHAITVSARDWTAALTYTVNFDANPTWDVGHLWSLSVEEQFYLIWPVLIVALGPRHAFRAAGLYLIGAPIVRLGVWAVTGQNVDVIEYFTPLHVDAIAAGCFIALAASQHTFKAWPLTPPAAVGVLSAAILLLAFDHVMASQVTVYDLTVRYSVDAIAFAAIIWCVVTAPPRWMLSVLEARPIAFLGVLSYSLYLWQQLFLNPHRTHWTARFPYNIVLAVAAALVCHYLVESPFLRIKDRLAIKNRLAKVRVIDAPVAAG